MYFFRISHKTGWKYEFQSQGALATKISCMGKSIIVNYPIEDIDQSYYNWQNQGFLIQRAFPYLSDSEREFLMTGMTDEDWKKLFPQGEEDA